MKKVHLKYIDPLYLLYTKYVKYNELEFEDKLNASGFFTTVKLGLYYLSK